jgi:excisionase family DNA binding protein
MQLLTVQETAELLKISTITVRRFIADGRLPAIKVGRAVRIEKADAESIAQPVTPKARITSAKRTIPPGRPTHSQGESGDHVNWLWRLAGIAGAEGEPTDVAERKLEYLAEASLDTHE